MSSETTWQSEKKRLLAVVLVLYFGTVAGMYLMYGTEERIVNNFHRLWVEDHNTSTWHQNTWLGTVSWVNPMDAWIFQEIVVDIKPDLIIETGTYKGGGALYLASILNQVNPEGKIITVDIEDYQKETAQHPLYQKYVTFIHGSSTAPATLDQIKPLAEGKKVLVILDSYHGKDHVIDEMDLYGPLVSKNSYMVVTDTHLNGHPVVTKNISSLPYKEGGPMEALDVWLPKHPEFTPDKTRERMLFTWNRKGYLLKNQ